MNSKDVNTIVDTVYKIVDVMFKITVILLVRDLWEQYFSKV